jgi:hypothetical protein
VPEIIRIDVGNARIKSVTRQRVEYLDEAGQKCFVDLEGCNGNYVKLVRATRYVADRWFLEDPPWIEFRNKRRTGFEFGSSNEALGVKLQLMKVRWLTFDAN